MGMDRTYWMRTANLYYNKDRKRLNPLFSGGIVGSDQTDRRYPKEAMKRENNEVMDTLKSLLSALDIVAFERIEKGQFQVIGSLAGWFVRMYPEAMMEKDRMNFGGRFLFLENFLIDAEKFWESEARGRLKSGFWIEVDAFGKERQLEASALNLRDRKILLIEFPAVAFAEKQSLIQKGREQKLEFQTKARITGRRLIDTLESMTDGFVSLDKRWRYTYINRRAAEMFGRNREDLIGKHIWTEFPEGIGQTFYDNCHKAIEEQKPITMEQYYPPWNRWLENRICPKRDGLSFFFQDITERKRAEELVKGQNQLLEMIASGQSLPETLTALIRFIESQAPEILCSVLLLDEDRIHIRQGAAPNLPAEFIASMDGLPIGPSAGSCGTAAFRGEAVFVEDIQTDPLWADYKHIALAHDLRACWSTPIFDEQHQVLGTFAVYYRRPALPEPFHLKLIDIATHVTAICINRDRA